MPADTKPAGTTEIDARTIRTSGTGKANFWGNLFCIEQPHSLYCVKNFVGPSTLGPDQQP